MNATTTSKQTFHIQGMDGASCAQSIEQGAHITGESRLLEKLLTSITPLPAWV